MCAHHQPFSRLNYERQKSLVDFLNYCSAFPKGIHAQRSTTIVTAGALFFPSPSTPTDTENGRNDPKVSKMGHAQQHTWCPIFNGGMETTVGRISTLYTTPAIRDYSTRNCVFFRGSTYIPCCCCCYCQRYGAVGKLPWLLMRRCGRGSSPTPQCRTLHSDKLPRRSGLGFALREKGVERQVQTPKQLVGAT